MACDANVEQTGLVGFFRSDVSPDATSLDRLVKHSFLVAIETAVYFDATDGGKDWTLTTGQPVIGKHFVFNLLMDPTGAFFEHVARHIRQFVETASPSALNAVISSIDSFRGDWEGKEPLKPDNHLMNEAFLRDEVIKDQRPEFRSTLVRHTVKVFFEPAHENMFDGFLLPSPPGSQDLDAFKATGLCTPLNTSDWGAFLLQSACRNGDAGLAHRGFEMLDPVRDEKAINAGIQLATDYYQGDLAQVLRQRLSRSLERATLENVSANPVRSDASPSRAIRL